jgi:hypothetical protein
VSDNVEERSETGLYIQYIHIYTTVCCLQLYVHYVSYFCCYIPFHTSLKKVIITDFADSFYVPFTDHM